MTSLKETVNFPGHRSRAVSQRTHSGTVRRQQYTRAKGLWNLICYSTDVQVRHRTFTEHLTIFKHHLRPAAVTSAVSIPGADYCAETEWNLSKWECLSLNTTKRFHRYVMLVFVTVFILKLALWKYATNETCVAIRLNDTDILYSRWVKLCKHLSSPWRHTYKRTTCTSLGGK